MSNIFEKLVKFYEKHGWCRNSFARDKYRHKVSHNSKRAANFCVLGAAMKLDADMVTGDAGMATSLAFSAKGITYPGKWNDRFTSKKQIIKALEKLAKG